VPASDAASFLWTMLWITQQYDAGKFTPLSRLRKWADRRSPHIARCIRFTSVQPGSVLVTPAHRRSDRLLATFHMERWEYFDPDRGWRDVPVPFTPREVFDRVRETYVEEMHAAYDRTTGEFLRLVRAAFRGGTLPDVRPSADNVGPSPSAKLPLSTGLTRTRGDCRGHIIEGVRNKGGEHV
jgi:hypothetical protein